MTSSSVRAWSRRASATVASGSLALLAVAALPPAAEGAVTNVGYRCTATGAPLNNFDLSVDLDTTLPPRMITGQTTQVVLIAAVTLPGTTAQEIKKKPATDIELTLTPQLTFGSAPPVSPTLGFPRTQIPDQTNATPMRLTDTSSSFAYTAPSAPGTLEVRAGTITGTLNWFDGDVKTSATLSCTPPSPGNPPVVDTASVASSTTTTLTVARTTAAYGQDVSASATVTSSSGIPPGEVSFTVGNVVTRARLDKAGVASLVLPDRTVGTHTVTATYVPTDPQVYVPSTSVTKLLTVSKAETRLKIPVTGKKTTTVTRIGVKATGAYDTVPTGKVRFKVKRLGRAGAWARNRTLSAAGTTRIGFGRLAAGRYKVVVIYKGDANHLDARKTKTFRVKPG